MLQIIDVKKRYVTGDFEQIALAGVSLNLRDNEFVAILGPSGSGKTTLLNIIGGLDRYDSGDLIINGVSTKKYKDRDWDSYRNHTIGFVFQAYNLIPHQTVLQNVELALTIGGISRKERKERALKALEQVGLKEQAHKRPNQMSGGQMQRVAIARALVNDPKVLLADEPTGALDTNTSIQVMDLLKEVAKDRLVVMVTHNPELAEQYANRIVRVKDGHIVDDTNPLVINEVTQAVHKNLGKSSMSLLTSFSLSFNNLLTKKGRTLLTAFAGSIGIIGIALILSLSTGFQNYIDKIQEDTMTSYPLTIQSETANVFSALLTMRADSMEKAVEGDEVLEQQMIASMMNSVGSNDLKSFKKYLEENTDKWSDYVTSIQYAYSVSPYIYTIDTTDTIVQVNPSNLISSIYSDSASSLLSSISSSTSMGTFSEWDKETMLDSTELVYGEYPDNYDEVLLVLTDENQIVDLMLYSLGYKDNAKLKSMITKIMAMEEVDEESEPMTLTYEQLVNTDLRLVDPSDLYQYNSEYNVYEDMSSDDEWMENVYENAERLKITGIAVTTSESGSGGIIYLPDLTKYVISTAEQSEIVQKQQADKDVDVFSGNPFDEESDSSGIDFNDLVTVDENALTDAFSTNLSGDLFMDEETTKKIVMAASEKVTENTEALTEQMYEGIKQAESAMAVAMIQAYMNNAKVTIPNDCDIWVNSLDPTQGCALSNDQTTDASSVVDNIENLLPSDVTDDPTVSALVESLKDVDLSSMSKEDVHNLIDQLPVTDEVKDQLKSAADSAIDSNDTSDVEVNADDYEQVNGIWVSKTYGYSEYVTLLGVDTFKENAFSDEAINTMVSNIPNLKLDAANLKKVLEGTFDAYVAQLDANSLGFVDASSLPDATGIVNEAIKDYDGLLLDEAYALSQEYSTYLVAAGIGDALSQVMTPLTDALGGGDIISIDTTKFANAFQFNMDEDSLTRLMESMMSDSSATYSNNLLELGYQDLDEPTSISIYFKDFESKELFLDFLQAYNDSVDEEKEIKYTDITGLLMSSVETIINSVTYVLIAFVSISLIVSSIMIGIITYISVLERTKEIGILRAIGASKRNISSIFNAETFIIGLCSGLIGVGLTYLLNIPINMIIYKVTENPDIVAVLPNGAAIVLVIIATVLTLIGGLIPSRAAAKKDPVIALRSE